MQNHPPFDETHVLHELRHYLPAQAPLKDFIHHNTLHAFQSLPFFGALRQASALFGYRVMLSLQEFRGLYAKGRIRPEVLSRLITEQYGAEAVPFWQEKLLQTPYNEHRPARVGSLRALWNRRHAIDLDSMVHPTLFRVLCSYLDQGISIWPFPGSESRFLAALRQLEQGSLVSFFRKKRAKNLLLDPATTLHSLLTLVVGLSLIHI